MRVSAGQLRRWRDNSSGDTFLILSIDPNFENESFWRVLLSDGRTRLWSQTRIQNWSEVVSEGG